MYCLDLAGTLLNVGKLNIAASQLCLQPTVPIAYRLCSFPVLFKLCLFTSLFYLFLFFFQFWHFGLFLPASSAGFKLISMGCHVQIDCLIFWIPWLFPKTVLLAFFMDSLGKVSFQDWFFFWEDPKLYNDSQYNCSHDCLWHYSLLILIKFSFSSENPENSTTFFTLLHSTPSTVFSFGSMGIWLQGFLFARQVL
jgi:hypothetical protein